MTEPLALTTSEASEALGASLFTVEYLRTELRKGRLFDGLGVRKGGKPTGTWIIPRANLPEFIERHAIADTAVQQLDPQPPACASGVSPRSRRMKEMRAS